MQSLFHEPKKNKKNLAMSNRNNENELKVMNENELIVVMYMAEK